MPRKQIFIALIAATLITSNAQAANAFGSIWMWFNWSIITPNNIIAPNN